jgi:hypothetical protein
MDDKKALIIALADEERRIKEALRDVGYYAYKIRFQPQGINSVPDFSLEAREWCDGDEKLINRS